MAATGVRSQYHPWAVVRAGSLVGGTAFVGSLSGALQLFRGNGKNKH